MRFVSVLLLCCVAALSFSMSPLHATDVDGPEDCTRSYTEFGDAPEGIPAYPSGVIGTFPTCFTVGGVGTQELFCPAISTPPGGGAGFVQHRTPLGDRFWLGCHSIPGAGIGLDDDTDGKVSTPAAGTSACSAITTDCVETAFGGMTFDQDECYGDGSDAGIQTPVEFVVCSDASVTFEVDACGPKNIFVNVLIDWNEDGDWNDNFDCAPGCAYEWVTKNLTVALTAGCNVITVPTFKVGPETGFGWMRISVSENPADDDYPWNGTLGVVFFQGGETEDYPVVITAATPTQSSSWGRVKTLYR